MSGITDEGSNQPKADNTSDDATPQPPVPTEPIIERVEGEHRTEPPQENTQPPADPPKKSMTAEWAHVIVSGVLVIVTSLVLLVYCSQLNQMKISAGAATDAAQRAKESIDQIERNEHLDQRAWVAMIDIKGIPEIGKIFTVTLTAKNSGKTFAKKLRSHVVVQTVAKGETPNFALGDEEESAKRMGSVSVIAPNGEYTTVTEVDMTRTDAKPANVTDAQLRELTSGDYQVFVYGNLNYIDIFKCEHWTTFCVELQSSLKYRSCREHNDADDNRCP